jgi:hydroxymethylglutaryl-CoA lyase
MSNRVKIVEVGPRDGLQNETTVLDITARLEFAQRLAKAGLRHIELGAFVSPDWVPQMAGTGKLIARALQWQKKGRIDPKVRFSALVPNMRGLENAMASGVREIAIFGASSESFSQHNINCSIAESFRRFAPVAKEAIRNKIKVRAYLSTCFGCPYEETVSEKQVLRSAEKMLAMGVYELSIGDTIGVANPKQVRSLLKKLGTIVPMEKLAMHFHDTRGTALANILASLDLGIRTFDSSLGGLGGCPYAPGASGNVATEDVIYLLHGMGFQTGVNLPQLIKINHWMRVKIQHSLPSRVGAAGI